MEGEAILDFKVYHSAPQYSLTAFNDTLLKSIKVCIFAYLRKKRLLSKSK